MGNDLNMRGWQPIETAPKDGTRIIVIGGRHSKPEIVEADGEWWRANPCLRAVPTHWMPLPELPLTTQGQAQACEIDHWEARP